MLVQIDKLGRLVLKKKLRERYGDSFIIVESEEGILLKPSSRDPFDGIEKISEKFKDYSLKELSEMGEEQAKEEVEEKLRRVR